MAAIQFLPFLLAVTLLLGLQPGYATTNPKALAKVQKLVAQVSKNKDYSSITTLLNAAMQNPAVDLSAFLGCTILIPTDSALTPYLSLAITNPMQLFKIVRYHTLKGLKTDKLFYKLKKGSLLPTLLGVPVKVVSVNSGTHILQVSSTVKGGVVGKVNIFKPLAEVKGSIKAYSINKVLIPPSS